MSFLLAVMKSTKLRNRIKNCNQSRNTMPIPMPGRSLRLLKQGPERTGPCSVIYSPRTSFIICSTMIRQRGTWKGPLKVLPLQAG